MSDNFGSSSDIIDVRDIISRVEELECERDSYNPDPDKPIIGVKTQARKWAKASEEDAAELATLTELLSDLRGNGGDEKWRGDWYPVTLIRDSYFEDYAQSLAEDIGAIDANASWPNNFIDWDAAADALKQDYTTVEYEDVTYWTR